MGTFRVLVLGIVSVLLVAACTASPPPRPANGSAASAGSNRCPGEASGNCSAGGNRGAETGGDGGPKAG